MIWGAFATPRDVLQSLHDLWQARSRRDEYFGTLVNAYLRAGGKAYAVRAGTSYVDVGTVSGYRVAFASLYDPASLAGDGETAVEQGRQP